MNRQSRYRGYRFPPEIISRAVCLYHRFKLSFRAIEDLLAERGVIVTYESIRQWCMKFGPNSANQLRKRQGRLGDMDEAVIVTVQGERRYLWRAVDQDDNVIDILVQKRKDKQAAKRFFRKMLKHQGRSPRVMVTDKLKSYGAARREVMPSTVHCRDRYANNRAEASHRHTRQHERQMRRFKSPGQAQRFLSVHSQVHNLFRLGRHRLKACHYRMFRSRAFSIWAQVACPDEIWHVDTSVVRLIDATKVYLHAVIDNYSRKILAWCVATRFDVMNTVTILREAARNAVSATSTPKLLVDGGSENLNANVDGLIGEGLLSRVIALRDIQFSNSLIETLWRTMKHQWLLLHPLDTAATVSRLVAFYVPAYNGEIPHAAFKGQTPDEMYYGTGADIPAKLEQEKTKARVVRLERNRATTCRQCQATAENDRRDLPAMTGLINDSELLVAVTASL